MVVDRSQHSSDVVGVVLIGGYQTSSFAGIFAENVTENDPILISGICIFYCFSFALELWAHGPSSDKLVVYASVKH